MLPPLTLCVLGFSSGLRHALEPDHLAAVSTLVAGQRSPTTTFRYACAWGAGHAAMLLIVGGALALLRAELPDRASDAIELVVALLLIGLGIRGLVQAASSERHARLHHHHHEDGVAHTHHGSADHLHVRGRAFSRLPFLVGLVHGLAGSGALTALVAAHGRTPAATLAFIAIYGVGAAAGMAALAGLLGWPLARVTRSTRALSVVIAASACISLLVGIFWGASRLSALL